MLVQGREQGAILRNCHLLALGFDCCSFAGSEGFKKGLGPLCSKHVFWTSTSVLVSAAVASVAAPDAVAVGRSAGRKLEGPLAQVGRSADASWKVR
jgi:hypothetical protein